jgi:hypothetical protein
VMLEQIPGTKPVTVGGDKGFDTRGFVAECRNLRVTPHEENGGNCHRSPRLSVTRVTIKIW